jgi:hypothetical protein
VGFLLTARPREERLPNAVGGAPDAGLKTQYFLAFFGRSSIKSSITEPLFPSADVQRAHYNHLF